MGSCVTGGSFMVGFWENPNESLLMDRPIKIPAASRARMQTIAAIGCKIRLRSRACCRGVNSTEPFHISSGFRANFSSTGSEDFIYIDDNSVLRGSFSVALVLVSWAGIEDCALAGSRKEGTRMPEALLPAGKVT